VWSHGPCKGRVQQQSVGTMPQQRTSVEGCTGAALGQREDEALAGDDLHDLGAPVQVLQPPRVDVAEGEGVELRLRSEQLGEAKIHAKKNSNHAILLCNTSES